MANNICKYARRIGLGHDFCRTCRGNLRGKSLALCQRRRKYLGTYYIDVLEEMSGIDIGIGINRFIRSSE